MTAPTRRGAAATCVALLFLLVAACSGDDDVGGSTALAVAPPTATAAANSGAAPTAAPPPPAAATAADARAFAEPDAGRAFDHIRVLAGEIGSRVSTTAEEREAADYIAAQLEAAGYHVAIEVFTVQVERDQSMVTLAGGEALGSTHVLLGAPNGAAGGRLIAGSLGRGSDLDGLDASGAVLLLDRGQITFAEKALNAQAAGAVAVIVVNNVPGPLVRGSLGDAPVRVPVVGVSPADGALLDRVADEGGSVTVRADLATVQGQSQNVVGRAAEQCDVYLGAHYDSVAAGPGANDNASGTAAMLELARTHRVAGVCAVAFGSEENGLWGSRAFVRAHDVTGARFMLNFDMMAKVTNARFVAGDDESSQDLADFAAEVADGLGESIPRGAFPAFASSDHATFSAAGVPAITVHSGDDERIHTALDDSDNVARDDLASMLRVAAAVLEALLSE